MRNYTEIVVGVRGSGKSTLLARRAARFPRRFVFDTVAERFGKVQGAHECLTLRETIDAMEAVAGLPTWTILASIPAEDAAKVCAIIAPERNPRGGYSLGVNGMMIECGEVETIAPNHAGIPRAVANLFHRGRHYKTSMILATRRPRDVHRLATSQADVVSCFRMHEPRDLDYIATLISSTVTQRIASLPQYHHIQYITGSPSARLIDPNGRAIETIKL